MAASKDGRNAPIWLWTTLFALVASIVAARLHASYRNDPAASLQKEVARLQRAVLSLDRRLSSPDKPSSGSPVEDPLQEEESQVQARLVAAVLFLLCAASPVVLYYAMNVLAPLLLPAWKDSSQQPAPLSKKLAYRVDHWFSTYSYVKPLALLIATLLLIAAGGLGLFAVTGDSLGEATWKAWSYVADSGNHVEQEGLGPRVIAIIVTFGGMMVFALMLGLVGDAIADKVESLRKGRSQVVEEKHTLILGWSDKLGCLVKQLANANASAGGGVVVILAEREKEEMEESIAKMEYDLHGTTVICRSGSPLVMADLRKVSVSTARAIVVLAELADADESDARVLRVVLSMNQVPGGLRGHLVVELSDIDNAELVKLVGGEAIETVVAHDVIGRLMLQCARQPGLAQVWENILGFDDAEFYVKKWPQLAGRTFGQALLSFPDAVLIGVIQAANGQTIINPPDSYVLKEEDDLLVIAEDDDSYAPTAAPAEVTAGWMAAVEQAPKPAEKVLLIGWRRDLDDLIQVLDQTLPAGSEVWLFSDVPLSERDERLIEGGLDPASLRTSLVHRCGKAVMRRHLEALPLHTFSSILILADAIAEESMEKADSQSLATLMLVRDIQSKRIKELQEAPPSHTPSPKPRKSWPLSEVLMEGELGGQLTRKVTRRRSFRERVIAAAQRTIVVTEILDPRTKALLSGHVCDHVLSNELISMALAMVSEDKQINRVLEELFAVGGHKLYVRKASVYVKDGEELCFFQLLTRARAIKEIILGYKVHGEEDLRINPGDKLVPRVWSADDTIIALART